MHQRFLDPLFDQWLPVIRLCSGYIQIRAGGARYISLPGSMQNMPLPPDAKLLNKVDASIGRSVIGLFFYGSKFPSFMPNSLQETLVSDYVTIPPRSPLSRPAVWCGKRDVYL